MQCYVLGMNRNANNKVIHNIVTNGKYKGDNGIPITTRIYNT